MPAFVDPNAYYNFLISQPASGLYPSAFDAIGLKTGMAGGAFGGGGFNNTPGFGGFPGGAGINGFLSRFGLGGGAPAGFLGRVGGTGTAFPGIGAPPPVVLPGGQAPQAPQATPQGPPAAPAPSPGTDSFDAFTGVGGPSSQVFGSGFVNPDNPLNFNQGAPTPGQGSAVAQQSESRLAGNSSDPTNSGLTPREPTQSRPAWMLARCRPLRHRTCLPAGPWSVCLTAPPCGAGDRGPLTCRSSLPPSSGLAFFRVPALA
jgi:hypothetical protein